MIFSTRMGKFMVNTGIYQCAVGKNNIVIIFRVLYQAEVIPMQTEKPKNLITYKFIHINSIKEVKQNLQILANFSRLTFLLRKIDWFLFIINWNSFMTFNFLSVWKKKNLIKAESSGNSVFTLYVVSAPKLINCLVLINVFV